MGLRDHGLRMKKLPLPVHPIVPETSVASKLTEEDWDKLINLVLEGCVVPVIGPELLTFRKDNLEEPLYTLWGRRLAEQAGLTIPELGPTPKLHEVANELSQKQSANDLAYEIDNIIRRKPWPIPEALRKLAAISSFRLYITTTIDHMLKVALEDARGGRTDSREGPRQTIEEIMFMPGGSKSEIDLPADFGDSDIPTLFYLFGACGNTPGTFAGTEDDLIEFSWSLLDKMQSPEQLYEYLKAKTVLLLGCDFPDWLGRFFIRALERGPHEERVNVYYVSARCDAGFAHYLKRRHGHVLTQQSPVTFVGELHQRWESHYKPEGNHEVQERRRRFKSGAVFLSYTAEDRQVVREIRDQLEAARIDTWMDESKLEPGDEFGQVIHANVQNASFFVAIVSKSLESVGPRGRFVLREWKWAEDASEARRKGDKFLQVVVIDDTPLGASFVNPPYRNVEWVRLRDGRLPPEFIDLLRRGIRRYRRSR